MSEKPNGGKPLFPGMKVPGPPDDLRAPVLNRARQALEDGPRRDLWARIWGSREARLAWAASVLVLAVGHVALPWGDAGQPGTAASTRERPMTAWTAPGDYGELAVIIDLPRLIFDDRTIATSSPAPRATENDPDTTAPTAESEENAS